MEARTTTSMPFHPLQVELFIENNRKVNVTFKQIMEDVKRILVCHPPPYVDDRDGTFKVVYRPNALLQCRINEDRGEAEKGTVVERLLQAWCMGARAVVAEQVPREFMLVEDTEVFSD
jgi:hypothetical protein